MVIQLLILEHVYLRILGIFYVILHCKTKQITRPYHSVLTNIQKQPPEVLCKKEFIKILPNSRKTPVPEPLFLNKVVGLSLQLFLKRDSSAGVFLWISRNFKNTFFTEHCKESASEHILLLWMLFGLWSRVSLKQPSRGTLETWKVEFIPSWS